RRLAPFYAEIEGSRWVSNTAFTAGLERNGPRAVREFAEAQARWERGEHLGMLRRKQKREP
ncbi:MAG: deiodinase-related protein, partial [Thermomicrobiales bacterium]